MSENETRLGEYPGSAGVGEGAFRRLVVWQQAFALAREIYRVAKGYPRADQFGLTSQIQRAALSIPSNIAEGYGRGRETRDYLRFLLMARGSLFELETCLLLSRELGYLPDSSYHKLNELKCRVGELLGGTIRSVGAKLEARERSDRG